MTMADKGKDKPKDVGAAKGMASPGDAELSADNNMKDKQFKGPKGEKTKAGESGSPGTNSLAGRGCTSDEAAEAFKKAGLKVPTSQKDGYR
jgi:hypothetical protein